MFAFENSLCIDIYDGFKDMSNYVLLRALVHPLATLASSEMSEGFASKKTEAPRAMIVYGATGV